MNGHKRICESPHGCGNIYQGSLRECPACGNPESFSKEVRMEDNDYIYDIESYPNVFTLAAIHAGTNTRYQFEISGRRNDILILLEFLHALRAADARMVGFNNIGYDYPILHEMIQWGEYSDYNTAYNKSQQIIGSKSRFGQMIWPSDILIPQIDLSKIHHFDNKSKLTSLKVIEFNMLMDNVRDLPFPPGTELTSDQIDVLHEYNAHDVDATLEFYRHTKPMISFRESLTEKYKRNFLNHNDTKIGKDFFVMQLEKGMPGSCYTRINGRREPRQTWRTEVRLNEVIFPYIEFQQPEFTRMKQWLSTQAVDAMELKGFFKNVNCTVNGFQYDFGAGGLHGSINSAIVQSDEIFSVVDLDVASYYPNIAIKNKLFPEHLSEFFCGIFSDLYDQRKTFKKGTSENAMLKLALNGTWGASNDQYSPFFDPKFTLAVTINGQLMLCLLAEWLLTITGVSMIQANTDGLTIRVPKMALDKVDQVKEAWEKFTCLELEQVTYKRMYIRDVNSYIAEGMDGKVKRIGAYAHERQSENPGTRELVWHKNHSSVIVAKAAEAALVHEIDIREFITSHSDPFDFMVRGKVDRKTKLMLTDSNGVETELQRTTRYYVAKEGGSLRKIMPPMKKVLQPLINPETGETDALGNKAKIKQLERKGWVKDGEPREMFTKERPQCIEKGFLVADANNINDFDWGNVNYEYYIAETEKIVNPLED